MIYAEFCLFFNKYFYIFCKIRHLFLVHIVKNMPKNIYFCLAD